MSFTENVVEELLEAPLHKTCCRKAMVFGLFMGAEIENGVIKAELRSEKVQAFATEILAKQFSAKTENEKITRAGRHFFAVKTKSRALSSFLQGIDIPEDEDTWHSACELVGFRCEECAHAFLRGVFIATGSITDPHKGYHMEFSLKSERRAELIFDMLTSEEAIPGSPNLVRRSARTGVYYKSNSTIFDVLSYIGAVQSGFDVANICIEHDIRNAENRATNCVARNIGRSIDACQKQIDAIQLLISNGRLDTVEKELQYTAKLRLENPDASLAELAMLHSPKISKSGLNRRISKLMEYANKD